MADCDVEIEIERLIHQTDAAFLVEVLGEEMWLPKSQVEGDPEGGTVYIPTWLARDKGII